MSVIVLDYPVEPKPRFGSTYGLPDHPELTELFRQREEVYAQTLESFEACRSELGKIRQTPERDRQQPHWDNGWLQGLDAVALYALVATGNPAVYLEVGSGNSTKFVRRAIRDHGLRTRIVSIDPTPRVEVDALCDELIRAPLEGADLTVFARLGAGDICFIDNSHRSFQNSDATVVFLEVLPRLAAGVLVGLHDILLPEDYPPEWSNRWYSEQYLLASYLLGGGRRSDVVLPSSYVSRTERFAGLLDNLFRAPLPAGIQRTGSAFWFSSAD